MVWFFFVFFLDPSCGPGSGSGLSPNGRFITSSPRASAQNSFLCSITVYVKDATINVYERLGVEVWVIVSWRIELDVCLRAVTTKHLPCHCCAF